ncbi:hypothetical protein PR202_gb07815 [Eleusine coracana subsp. coracana]|uniref:Uncharacterized protein n=1 Tax=Eleusine coracana subsp. coracana TaxID=191504 RepID=A0AAV5ED41_ELECO|nr:hypothetical protein PR202_gb07815 [Eleusine coracana subsp. coracana]
MADSNPSGSGLAGHSGVRCTLAVTRYVLGSSESPQPGNVHVVGFSDGCDNSGYDEVGDERDYLLGDESARGRAVRAVVYDALLLWVPRVARQQGVQCAAFFTQACAVNVAYAHAWAGKLRTIPVADALPHELPGLPAGLEAEYMSSRWGAKTVGPTVPSEYLDNRITDDKSYV